MSEKKKKYQIDGLIIDVPEAEFKDYTPIEVGREFLDVLEKTKFTSKFIGKIREIKK